jgi:hypothetical protein
MHILEFSTAPANIHPGCLYGYPSNGTTTGGPCLTPSACGGLSTALEVGIVDPSGGSTYDYCSADGGAFLGQYFAPCTSCLMGLSDTSYLSNCMSSSLIRSHTSLIYSMQSPYRKRSLPFQLFRSYAI